MRSILVFVDAELDAYLFLYDHRVADSDSRQPSPQHAQSHLPALGQNVLQGAAERNHALTTKLESLRGHF